MNQKSAAILLAMGLTLQSQPSLYAGTLEPPGPPGPTFKTLSEIEPRIAIKANPDVVEAIVIDQSGSYYLVEDITAIPNNNALTIAADDVTLDLNGFTIRGNLEVTDGYGIEVSGNNVTIRNGSVRFADLDGIKCNAGKLLKLHDVNSMNNGGSGLVCSEARVINGDFYQNGANGIAGSANYLEGIRATENGTNGVSMSGRSVLSHALVNDNDQWGVICVQGTSLVFQSFISGNASINNFGCTASEGTFVAPDPP
jgi:hypothetical protein